MSRRDELIGAMIGLANTATGNAYKADGETDELVLSVLRALSAGAEEEALAQMLRRVRAEKTRLAPDCAVCKNPCGRNADYDMNDLYSAQQDVRSLKLLLLGALCGISVCAGKIDMPFVYRAVRALGDEWTADRLLPLVLEAGDAYAAGMIGSR